MNARHAKWWKKHMGESPLSRWILLLVSLLFGLPWTATGQTASTNATLVAVDLAQHVATEHVQANNQPYQWQYLDYLVLYDVQGNPNGYAFVFGKAGSRFSGSAVLRQHITEPATTKATQEQESHASADDDLFAFDDLATVITGATTESPLILRHFRGAPEFWIEAVKQEATRRAGTSEATQVVMVTPMDFRLVTTSAKAARAPSAQAATLSLAASAETVAVHSKKAERISVLRQQVKEREERTRKQVDSMTPQQKQVHEAARQGRKDFLRAQWDEKRAEWTATTQTGEEEQ